MASPRQLLTDRLRAAFDHVGGAAGEAVEVVVRESQFAHFQCDAALPAAKALGRAPREIAAAVVAAAELADLCTQVEVSGPGFVNLTLSDAALDRLLAEAGADRRFGVSAIAAQTVVVDYSGPNAAKEMHVGHLRSTIIGDAIVRLLTWRGHQVVRQNHLGEWGTPFGMLVEHLLDVGEDSAVEALSIGDLNGFYRGARETFDASPAFADRARARVVLLQSGDAETLRLWTILVTASQGYFLTVYERLGVLLTAADFRGESTYNDELVSVVDELAAAGLLRESEGALCTFPTGFTGRENAPLPLIVRKGDGGFGYAATDLATIRHRCRDLKADRMLYVVGLPQRQHLAMVFATAAEAGWLAPPSAAEHIGFGSVLGADGKVLRTRAGESVRLVDLLDEAVRRAAEVLAQKGSDLTTADQAEVARAVGIGAVKFADLSVDRVKDYVFDYDRMLSFDGATAPYLQYAHARIRSLLRRAEGLAVGPAVTVATDPERQLALRLLALPDLVESVSDSLELHRIAHYLMALASDFTSFYERCPILRDSTEDVRASRLLLAQRTGEVLAFGLSLLGIAAPEAL